MRYIRQAAITSQAWTSGRNHSECFRKRKKITIQGFVDNDFNFVDRKTALEIAEQAGQIIRKHAPTDELLSEDMEWDECSRSFLYWEDVNEYVYR